MKNNAYHEKVMALARAGWKLFPARYDARRRSHIGLCKWGAEATDNPEKIGTWIRKHPNAYFCVALAASNLTIIDLDDKNGRSGSAALDTLELIHGQMPPTLSVQTPSGGRHLYFKNWCGRQTRDRLGSGLDTPGMAPVPGSRVPGKGAYEIRHDAPMAVLPGWVPNLLGPGPRNIEERLRPLVAPDQSQNIARAVEYARCATPAVEDQGGDLTTYLTAAGIRDLGISPEVCFDIMAAYYNPRCIPSWQSGDLKQKIRNVYAYARNRPGQKAAQADFAERFFYDDNPEEIMPDFRMLQLATIPIRRWIMKYRFAPGHVTGTMAPPGVGKSTYTILEAISVASGRNLTGFTVKMPGSVWVYSTEETLNEQKRRFAAACQTNGIDHSALPHGVHFTSGRTHPFKLVTLNDRREPVINTALVEQTIQRIEEHRIRLFIIDPFVRAHGVNENDNNAIDLVMQAFTIIAEKTQCAVHVVHHSRKKSSGGGSDAESARGASAFIGAVRIAHILQPMRDQDGDDLAVPKERRGEYLELVSAKANAAPREGGFFYWRHAVMLPNGDEDGTVALRLIDPKLSQWSANVLGIMDAVATLMQGKTEASVYALSLDLEKHYLYLFDGRSLSSIRRFLIDFFDQPIDYNRGEKPVRFVCDKENGRATIIAQDPAQTAQPK